MHRWRRHALAGSRPWAVRGVMTEHRFPPPWTVEKIPGGLKVVDANGQSLAYVYSREKPDDAHMAGVLTENEARRIASNIAKLPTLLAKHEYRV